MTNKTTFPVHVDITTKKTHRAAISQQQLIAILRNYIDLELPVGARVFVRVPGGGAWSAGGNLPIAVAPIQIEWDTETQS